MFYFQGNPGGLLVDSVTRTCDGLEGIDTMSSFEDSLDLLLFNTFPAPPEHPSDPPADAEGPPLSFLFDLD